MSSAPVEVKSSPSSGQRAFTFRQRILLWLISAAAYWAIRFICPTLRFSSSWEEPPSPPDLVHEKQVIYSFWHRAVFPAAWMFRNQGIAVMVSRSFDGEYIARIIERFGFIAVRGSSTRGGAEALLGMKTHLEQGAAVAFTIDGPRGPKFVAKPGPVRLARVTGMPMRAFYVAPERSWVLNTWDRFLIPKPFSKILVRASSKIMVPSDADDVQMNEHLQQLQAALERVTKFVEENVTCVGSGEFPLRKY